MSSHRTFVFDSADVDLSYEDVEATFYSTSDSDSNLSSSTDSSDSSSDSDSDSSNNNSVSTHHHDQTVSDVLHQIAQAHEHDNKRSRHASRRRLRTATDSASRAQSIRSSPSLVGTPDPSAPNADSNSSFYDSRRNASRRNPGQHGSGNVDADTSSSDRHKAAGSAEDSITNSANPSYSTHLPKRQNSTQSRRESSSDENKYKFWLKSRRSKKNLDHSNSDGDQSKSNTRSFNSDGANNEYDDDDDDDSMIDIIHVTAPSNTTQEPPGIMIHTENNNPKSSENESKLNHSSTLTETTTSSDNTIADSSSHPYNEISAQVLNPDVTIVEPTSTSINFTSPNYNQSLLVPSAPFDQAHSPHSPSSLNIPSSTSLHPDSLTPYHNPGHGVENYGSTHSFPTFSSPNDSSNQQTDEKSGGTDVMIEEPVRHKDRNGKPRFGRSADKTFSVPGASGGGGGGDSDDDNNDHKKNGHRRRKNRKKKKTRRRYSNSVVSASAARRRAGWEPGVDIKTTDVILQSIGSSVTIVDYNETRYRVVQTEVFPEKPSNPEEEEEPLFTNESSAEMDSPNVLPIIHKWWHKNNPQLAGKEVLDNKPSPTLKPQPAPPNVQVPSQFTNPQFSSRVPGQNKEFYHHLDNRPDWSSVRWISVNGLSWETISAISQRYQLHRLAIEDMIDIPQRTKMDMYPTHTFCVLPMHKLIYYKPESAAEEKKKHNLWFSKSQEKQEAASEKAELKSASSSKFVPANHASTGGMPTATAPDAGLDLHKTKSNSSVSSKKSKKHSNHNKISYGIHQIRRRTLSVVSDADSSDSSDSDSESSKPLSSRIADLPNNTIYDWNNPYVANLSKPLFIEKKRPLAQYHRAVGVEQVSMFLTDENTVITFFEHSAPDIERPLLARLATKYTMLRESCDPSMLLQAVMDIIVDQVQPIISAYRRRLTELEVDAMMTPTMSHTQDLHFMAAELSLLRNNIVPITSLIQSLRDHGTSSAPAVLAVPPLSGPGLEANAAYDTVEEDLANFAAAAVPEDHTKLCDSRISPVAKVYLADVADHLLSYTLDLDVMRGNTKNMIDMIFNVISIKSSDSVNQLSLVSVVFMPLSFWTGYYGMNFKATDWLTGGYNMYWKIAIPFSFGIMMLVMITTIVAWFQTTIRSVRKKWARHQRKMEKKMIKKNKKKE